MRAWGALKQTSGCGSRGVLPECRPASADRWEVMTPAVETAQVYGRLLSFSYLSVTLPSSLLLSVEKLVAPDLFDLFFLLRQKINCLPHESDLVLPCSVVLHSYVYDLEPNCIKVEFHFNNYRWELGINSNLSFQTSSEEFCPNLKYTNLWKQVNSPKLWKNWDCTALLLMLWWNRRMKWSLLQATEN